jgi:hypothetical protein
VHTILASIPFSFKSRSTKAMLWAVLF